MRPDYATAVNECLAAINAHDGVEATRCDIRTRTGKVGGFRITDAHLCCTYKAQRFTTCLQLWQAEQQVAMQAVCTLFGAEQEAME